MRPQTYILISILALLLGAVFSSYASAGVWGEAGVGYTSYTGEMKAEPSFHVKAGLDDNPLYLWGSYEQPNLRILGQPLASASIASFGLGARHRWDDWHVFIEGGYGVIDEDQNDNIRQEIVYTYLVDRHHVHMRPIPVQVDRPYQQDSYRTSYEIDDVIVGRIGLGYSICKWAQMTVSYRYAQADEHVELWDEETRANGGGWWQESYSRNLNAWELGLFITF